MAYDPAKRQPIWAQITLDADLQASDVRLWFYLVNVRRDRKSGKAWPEQRTISADTHSNRATVRASVERLERGGYLQTEIAGQNHHHVYSFPNLVARKLDPRNGSGGASFNHSRAGNETLRVVHKLDPEPYLNEPKLNKGESAPNLFPRERDKEIEDLTSEIRRVNEAKDYRGSDGKLKPEWQQYVAGVREKRDKLRAQKFGAERPRT